MHARQGYRGNGEDGKRRNRYADQHDETLATKMASQSTAKAAEREHRVAWATVFGNVTHPSQCSRGESG